MIPAPVFIPVSRYPFNGDRGWSWGCRDNELGKTMPGTGPRMQSAVTGSMMSLSTRCDAAPATQPSSSIPTMRIGTLRECLEEYVQPSYLRFQFQSRTSRRSSCEKLSPYWHLRFLNQTTHTHIETNRRESHLPLSVRDIGRRIRSPRQMRTEINPYIRNIFSLIESQPVATSRAPRSLNSGFENVC